MDRGGVDGIEVPLETMRYIICEKMHWDYYTYQRQPWTFIQEVWEHMKAEGESAKAKAPKP